MEEIANKDTMFFLIFYFNNYYLIDRYLGCISASGQLPTYPSPNPTLTLTCYQLIVVELGEG